MADSINDPNDASDIDRNELREIRQVLEGLIDRVEILERERSGNAEASQTDKAEPAKSEPKQKRALKESHDLGVSEEDFEVVFAKLRDKSRANLEGESAISPIPDDTEEQSTKGSLESLIGERLFTWVGGILLVLAMAYFVVWSWRNLDFPDWVRVAIMHVASLLIVAWGSWFKKRDLPTQSQAIYGTGIFGLYASALAMTHLYRLGGDLHEFFGFIDGALITALAIFLSLRDRSVGIVLLGAFGGYLTPLMTIQHAQDSSIVFAYLAMLNVALLVCSYFGNWNFLKPMAWIATALIFLMSIGMGHFDSEFQANALLALHGTIFLAAVTVPHWRWRTESSNSGNTVLALNGLGYFGSFLLVNELSLDFAATISFVLTTIFATVTWISFRRLGIHDRLGRLGLALTCLFLTIGLTFQFRENPDAWATIWAIEAVVFGLIGFSFRDQQMLATSGIVFGLTIARSILLDSDPTRSLAYEPSFTDPRAISWLMYSVMMTLVGSSYWWMPKVKQLGELESSIQSGSGQDELQLATGFESNSNGGKSFPWKQIYWAAGFLAVANLVFLMATVFHFQPEFRWVLLIAGVDCGLIWAVGIFKSIGAVRNYASSLAIPLVLFGCVLLAQDFGNIEKNWTMVSRVCFFVVSAILIAAGLIFWQVRARVLLEGEQLYHGLLSTTGHIGMLGVVTAEIILMFSGQPAGSTSEMATWSIAWGVYAAVLVTSGFLMRYPTYRFLGIGLFSIVLLKVFLIDLSQFELIVRVIALMCIGLLMLGVSVLYQKFKVRIDE